MDKKQIAEFIRKQKVAFICSVDEEGFPNVKAMLKPRKTDGLREFYFSTNTSSMRVKQFLFFYEHFLHASQTVSEQSECLYLFLP